MFIRIVLVLLVLSCSVGLAQAEWRELDTISTYGGFTIYGDPTTLRLDTEKRLARMWVLYDFKTVQKSSKGAYLSMKELWHFNCKEGRYRTSTASYFSGHMAKGNLVFNQTTERVWESVPPGTVSADLSELACRAMSKTMSSKIFPGPKSYSHIPTMAEKSDNFHFQSLCTLIGFVVVNWALAEQSLDFMVEGPAERTARL